MELARKLILVPSHSTLGGWGDVQLQRGALVASAHIKLLRVLFVKRNWRYTSSVYSVFFFDCHASQKSIALRML